MTIYVENLKKQTIENLSIIPDHWSDGMKEYRAYRNNIFSNMFNSILKSFDSFGGLHLYQLAMVDLVYNAVMYDYYVISSASKTIGYYSNSTKYKAITELHDIGLVISVPNHYQGNQYVLMINLNHISSCVDFYLTSKCPDWVIRMDKYSPPMNRTDWSKDKIPF